MKMFRILIVFTSILIFHSSTLFAEEKPFEVVFTSKLTPFADIKSKSGDFEFFEVDIRIKKDFTIFDDIPLETSIGGNHYITEDDDTTVSFPHGFKSRGLHLTTSLPLNFVNDERWRLGIGINPSFQTANGVNFASNGFRMRTNAFLIFKENENFIVKGGITFRSEYDSDYIPYIGLVYNPDNPWSLNITSSESEIESQLNFKIDDVNTVFLELAYEIDEFEISKSGDKGRVFEFTDKTIGVGFKHIFNEHFQATIHGGGVLQRKLEYLDGVGKTALEPAPYGGFDIAVSF